MGQVVAGLAVGAASGPVLPCWLAHVGQRRSWAEWLGQVLLLGQVWGHLGQVGAGLCMGLAVEIAEGLLCTGDMSRDSSSRAEGQGTRGEGSKRGRQGYKGGGVEKSRWRGLRDTVLSPSLLQNFVC